MSSCTENNNDSNASFSNGGTATSLAVLVSPNSSSSSSGGSGNLGGGGSSGSIHIIVWANLSRNRLSKDDRWRNTLRYYNFLDDSRFTHLDSLLTRLAPFDSQTFDAIHIACTEKLVSSSSSMSKMTLGARKKMKQLNDIMQRVQDVVDSRTDLCQRIEGGSSAAAAENSTKLSKMHANLPSNTNDQSFIDSIVMQLLVDTKQAQLAYRGDVQITSVSNLLRGLGFWLHSQGLLQNSLSDDIISSYQIQQGILNSHLLLDRTAADCIHLLPPANAGLATVVGGTSNNNSLLGILSSPCYTKMGKRLVEQWLRQPLIQLEPILFRQNAVSYLVENSIDRDALRDEAIRNFSNIDIAKLALQLGSYAEVEGDDDHDSLVGSTKSALQALYQLYLIASKKLPLLLETMQNMSIIQEQRQQQQPDENNDNPGDFTLPLLYTVYVDLTSGYLELERSSQLAEAVLDLDLAPREFVVKPSFKEELQEIKNELLAVDAELEDCHNEMNRLWAETNGMDYDPASSQQVRLETNDNADQNNITYWQFRLPNTNDSKVLQEELSHKVKVHRILKNGVYFTTKQLRELGEKKLDLTKEYDKHQRLLVSDAMKVASSYQGTLEHVNELIAHLDVVSSLAQIAAHSANGYCKPVLTDGVEDGLGIELKKARHPCVELQTGIDYVPNDIELKFGESNFLLVTGPNMGGKSTYIRSLGAIVTLAQMGSFVPCASAKINIIHHILARVGAGDLQDRGISTFMAEMLESSSILQQATKRSLIIIDELGRGTSTFDGYGLAKAISEHIIEKIGCMTVFATHFHELTALETEKSKYVKNCHVTAHVSHSGNAESNSTTTSGLTFLYEVQKGPCLESFGIQVAEMAKVPASVITDAKVLAKQLESFDYRQSNQMNTDDGDNDDEEHKKDLDFIDRFRKLPLDKMTKDQQRQALKELVENM